MKVFQKLARVGLLFILAMNLFLVPVAQAQTNIPVPTLLPQEDQNQGGRRGECIGLATAIRTGDISLRKIPCFLKYFAQVLIGIGGTLAVIFVMIGGYTYVLGRDEDKDRAKRTVTYALIGLAIALLAWVITDIVLQVATE